MTNSKNTSSGNAYRSPSAAFADERIFLVTPNDERLAIYSDPAMLTSHLQQSFDGPGYLVIGPNVLDSSLEKVLTRFGIPVDDLVAFRGMTRQLYANTAEVNHG